MVAETLTRGKLAVRFERVGRPEVKNLMLAPKQFDPVNRDLEIRDLYNMEDAFHLARGLPGRLPGAAEREPRFLGRTRRQDGLAADENGAHPLTELMLADFLVVDVTKPYAEQGSFLEIELAAREARTHETCGGRALNDDVMDTIFTLLVNAGNGPTIRDGVDRATMPGVANVPVPGAAEPRSPRASRAPLAIGSDHVNLRDEASSNSTTSRAGRCTNGPPRTSAPICCCASTTATPDGSWSDGCIPWSTPAGPPLIRPATPGSPSPSPTTA